MAALSERVRRRIERDFPAPGSAEQVAAMVGDAADSERIQAAIVLLANGNIGYLRDACQLAQIDWRDVLVGAQLASDDWPARLMAEFGDADDPGAV